MEPLAWLALGVGVVVLALLGLFLFGCSKLNRKQEERDKQAIRQNAQMRETGE